MFPLTPAINRFALTHFGSLRPMGIYDIMLTGSLENRRFSGVCQNQQNGRIIPAVLLVLCAAALQLLCWDTPRGRRFDLKAAGKTRKASVRDYLQDGFLGWDSVRVRKL